LEKSGSDPNSRISNASDLVDAKGQFIDETTGVILEIYMRAFAKWVGVGRCDVRG
jgi:hypothetical protein